MKFTQLLPCRKCESNNIQITPYEYLPYNNIKIGYAKCLTCNHKIEINIDNINDERTEFIKRKWNADYIYGSEIEELQKLIERLKLKEVCI